MIFANKVGLMLFIEATIMRFNSAYSELFPLATGLMLLGAVLWLWTPSKGGSE